MVLVLMMLALSIYLSENHSLHTLSHSCCVDMRHLFVQELYLRRVEIQEISFTISSSDEFLLSIRLLLHLWSGMMVSSDSLEHDGLSAEFLNVELIDK